MPKRPKKSGLSDFMDGFHEDMEAFQEDMANMSKDLEAVFDDVSTALMDFNMEMGACPRDAIDRAYKRVEKAKKRVRNFQKETTVSVNEEVAKKVWKAPKARKETETESIHPEWSKDYRGNGMQEYVVNLEKENEQLRIQLKQKAEKNKMTRKELAIGIAITAALSILVILFLASIILF